MKIRRSMVVLFIIASLVIPISLYRNMFSENASEEFVSTVGIISNVLMTVFLMLVVAFSIFSDDFPHSYTARKSGGLGMISMLAAGACGFSSILGIISNDSPLYSGTGGIVFMLLGLLTVLGMMFYSVSFFKGENLILSFPVIPILPALWYGYRMLAAFLRSASMADISAELPVIAMCCSFTIFLLTIGKLFCCINSNSIKWGFAAGCIGIMTSLLYSVNWLVKDCKSTADLAGNPLVFTDIIMALFAIGALFHVSNPAEYFDDEEWDDYFYETYDLPKPNLILHTPVDELEENSLLDSDINESPYIPVNSTVGSGRRNTQENYPPKSAQHPQQPPANSVPSYIANPAAYYAQYPQPAQQPYYPPAYPAYPVYPYQGMVPPNSGYAPGYPNQTQPVEYVNPYDAAAAQYQYERRRSELQSRELEKLTGEVDSSLAKLQSNVTRNQPPSNQYVNAAPDERLKDRATSAPQSRNVRLAQGYSQSGERLTDHVDRLEQQNRRVPTQTADDDDEYTYEYYYPTDSSRYSPNQFNPTDNGRGYQGGRR